MPSTASANTSFLFEASARYPTIDRALQALCQLGNPPVPNGPFDPSVFEDPGSNNWTCLYIPGALTCDMHPSNRSHKPSIPRQIKRHWTPHLYIWIRCFLQALTSTGVLEPSNGYQVAEYILQSIPSILMWPTTLPKSQQKSEIFLLLDTSAGIRDLVLGVWLMALAGEQYDHYWLTWTKTARMIFDHAPRKEFPLRTEQQIRDFYSDLRRFRPKYQEGNASNTKDGWKEYA